MAKGGKEGLSSDNFREFTHEIPMTEVVCEGPSSRVGHPSVAPKSGRPSDVSDELEPISSTVSLTEYPDGGWEAYSVVLGSFIGLIATFGALNSVGAVQDYVSSNQLAGTSTSTISWIFSIYVSLSFLVGVFVGPYFDARGSFQPMVAGTVLLAVGYMTTAQCTEVWHFVLAFSICLGVGNALCITPLIAVISHWFYHKRGRATGSATIGGSIGGVVIPLMLRALYPKVGYAWAIRILGFFCVGCMVIAIFLARSRILREPSEDNGRRRDKIARMGKQLFDYSALKDLRFDFLTLGVWATELALMSTVTYLPSYARKQGLSESEAYLLVTIFNATGIAGRIIPGYLSDIIGHYNIMVITMIGTVLCTFIVWLPFGHLRAGLYAFCTIFGFFSATILSLTPVCLGVITPTDVFGQRYGLMYFFVSVANMGMIPVGGAIIGSGSEKNYNNFVIFNGVFAVFGTVCWWLTRYNIVGLKLNAKI
ncbi:probable transporter Mch4p [Diutina catenulata]